MGIGCGVDEANMRLGRNSDKSETKVEPFLSFGIFITPHMLPLGNELIDSRACPYLDTL